MKFLSDLHKRLGNEIEFKYSDKKGYTVVLGVNRNLYLFLNVQDAPMMSYCTCCRLMTDKIILEKNKF
jgi:hypothetical protein